MELAMPLRKRKSLFRGAEKFRKISPRLIICPISTITIVMIVQISRNELIVNFSCVCVLFFRGIVATCLPWTRPYRPNNIVHRKLWKFRTTRSWSNDYTGILSRQQKIRYLCVHGRSKEADFLLTGTKRSRGMPGRILIPKEQEEAKGESSKSIAIWYPRLYERIHVLVAKACLRRELE